jgi:hypothetical protein
MLTCLFPPKHDRDRDPAPVFALSRNFSENRLALPGSRLKET